MTTRPHDALFKAAFEAPEHAAALFRSILPPALCEAVAWNTLTRENGSFIDPALHDRHTDLLFSARIGDSEVLFYLLLEHQSTFDLFMPLRMLIYLVRVWEQYDVDPDAKSLPLIVPAVVSHAPGGWRGPLSLHELLDPSPSSIPGLAAHVPNFTLLLDDLTELDNEGLEGRRLALFSMLAVWLLRDARDMSRLFENLDFWKHPLREAAEAPGGMRALTQLIEYITLVGEKLHFDRFHAILVEQVPQAKEVVVTIAEQLRQEGWEKGLEKGRVESLVATLEKQLTLKFGELAAEHAERLRGARGEELERWLERILWAESVEAVFAG